MMHLRDVCLIISGLLLPLGAPTYSKDAAEWQFSNLSAVFKNFGSGVVTLRLSADYSGDGKRLNLQEFHKKHSVFLKKVSLLLRHHRIMVEYVESSVETSYKNNHHIELLWEGSAKQTSKIMHTEEVFQYWKEALGIVEWSEWTAWSHCTVSCGFGDKTRHRKCKHKKCEGSSEETIRCGPKDACPTTPEKNDGSSSSRNILRAGKEIPPTVTSLSTTKKPSSMIPKDRKSTDVISQTAKTQLKTAPSIKPKDQTMDRVSQTQELQSIISSTEQETIRKVTSSRFRNVRFYVWYNADLFLRKLDKPCSRVTTERILRCEEKLSDAPYIRQSTILKIVQPFFNKTLHSITQMHRRISATKFKTFVQNEEKNQPDTVSVTNSSVHKLPIKFSHLFFTIIENNDNFIMSNNPIYKLLLHVD